uniref:Uncharacterized protein n=1 Tax=Rhipicephalus appendiculatus TaxID=34631 RepID=A0A131YAJ0_RHIAP
MLIRVQSSSVDKQRFICNLFCALALCNRDGEVLSLKCPFLLKVAAGSNVREGSVECRRSFMKPRDSSSPVISCTEVLAGRCMRYAT